MVAGGLCKAILSLEAYLDTIRGFVTNLLSQIVSTPSIVSVKLLRKISNSCLQKFYLKALMIM